MGQPILSHDLLSGPAPRQGVAGVRLTRQMQLRGPRSEQTNTWACFEAAGNSSVCGLYRDNLVYSDLASRCLPDIISIIWTAQVVHHACG